MTEIIHPEQVYFMIEKGRRDSVRLAEKILRAIKNDLIGKTFIVDGVEVKIKLFSDVVIDEETQKPRLGFDAKGDFGHIEFYINQTGWGS
jgi:hypothetical protein